MTCPRAEQIPDVTPQLLTDLTLPQCSSLHSIAVLDFFIKLIGRLEYSHCLAKHSDSGYQGYEPMLVAIEDTKMATTVLAEITLENPAIAILTVKPMTARSLAIFKDTYLMNLYQSF